MLDNPNFLKPTLYLFKKPTAAPADVSARPVLVAKKRPRPTGYPIPEKAAPPPEPGAEIVMPPQRDRVALARAVTAFRVAMGVPPVRLRVPRPEPDFDCKKATPQQWAAFNAGQTPEQRAIDRAFWAWSAALWAMRTTPSARRRQLIVFATNYRDILLASFDRGMAKKAAVAEFKARSREHLEQSQNS